MISIIMILYFISICQLTLIAEEFLVHRRFPQHNDDAIIH